MYVHDLSHLSHSPRLFSTLSGHSQKFKFHLLTDTKTKTSVNWTINFSLESSLISASSASLWICVFWCAFDSFSVNPSNVSWKFSSVLWSFHILLPLKMIFWKVENTEIYTFNCRFSMEMSFLLLLTFLHIPYSIIKELWVFHCWRRGHEILTKYL